MPIRGKLISEISPADIFELIKQQTPEDECLDFKKEILDPRKPTTRLEKDKEDWVTDLVAFANGLGGHIIIGLEADHQERAFRLNPMMEDQAKKLADTLRDLAIAWVKPHISPLVISSFQIAAEEWIVIARVPDSQDKPHMCNYGDRTRFTIRTGNRKREMMYDEIRNFFLGALQEQRMVRLLSEVESISLRLADLERGLRKVE